MALLDAEGLFRLAPLQHVEPRPGAFALRLLARQHHAGADVVDEPDLFADRHAPIEFADHEGHPGGIFGAEALHVSTVEIEVRPVRAGRLVEQAPEAETATVIA